MNLLKMCPQIHLKILTTIDTLSGIAGPDVPHPTGVTEVAGSFLGSDKDFNV